MPAKKSSLNIPWPFAPKEVRLNTDTNLLKLVAMATMLIDHTGKMFFAQYNIMRIIGRLAFPIYAYCIAVGCVYTHNRLKYLSRIVLLGLISQPFYAVALGHTTQRMYAVSFAENPLRAMLNFYVESWAKPSILLTLAMGILVIWSIREKQLVLTAALALLVWKIQGSLDYGWRGVVLMVLFYLFCTRWWISLPVVLTYMIWWGMRSSSYELFGIRFGIQMFAIFALPLIYIPTYSKLKINKWIFYLFYPAHLIFIMLVQRLMG